MTTPNEIPTPRTDAAVTGNSEVTTDEYEDLASFARTLERETIAQAKRIEELEAALADLIPAVELYEDEGPEGEGWQSEELCNKIAKARALLNRQP